MGKEDVYMNHHLVVAGKVEVHVHMDLHLMVAGTLGREIG